MAVVGVYQKAATRLLKCFQNVVLAITSGYVGTDAICISNLLVSMLPESMSGYRLPVFAYSTSTEYGPLLGKEVEDIDG